jgi:hypothetical protein
MAANAPSRSNRNAHVALKSRPLEPLQTYHPSSNVNIEDRTLSSMANNADADYVEELDIDQELRSRNQRSKSTPQAPIYTPQQSSKSGASSRSIESDREDAPLLSPTERDYGSADGNDRRDSQYEWAGEADFKGLSWWNRPSVSAQWYT